MNNVMMDWSILNISIYIIVISYSYVMLSSYWIIHIRLFNDSISRFNCINDWIYWIFKSKDQNGGFWPPATQPLVIGPPRRPACPACPVCPACPACSACPFSGCQRPSAMAERVRQAEGIAAALLCSMVYTVAEFRSVWGFWYIFMGDDGKVDENLVGLVLLCSILWYISGIRSIRSICERVGSNKFCAIQTVWFVGVLSMFRREL